MTGKKRRKKGFRIRFELSLPGLLSLGVVCFCIFLWMFLLGIWTGQSVLRSVGVSGPRPVDRVADRPGRTRKPAADGGGDAKPIRKAGRKATVAEPAASEPSFFTLQVASFKEPARAGKSLQSWRERGYETFLQPPDDDSDPYTRVFVGKFRDLAAANALAARLEDKEQVKAFIALLPASKIRLP